MLVLRVLLFVGLALFALSGCVVEARPAPPPRCPGGEWIAGHYGPHGRWHPGHWRCPGVVEVVEVD
ncbi:MAG TPA: hypothetical protein VEK07_02495 [Polyangiaceae bacterium]|nr:hypothetical protein [Polyangiaceae bacterium]